MKTSRNSWITSALAAGLLWLTVGCGPVQYVETDYYPEVVCPAGSAWDGAWCVAQPGVVVVECPPRTRWVNGMCMEFVPHNHPYCPRGTWFDGASCVWRQVGCPPGYRFDGRGCIRGVASCPNGSYWNGRRCIRGAGPDVGCPAGTVFDGRRCQPARPGGGIGGGKPGHKPGDGHRPGGGAVDNTPPGKGMLPAAQCPPGQRWDPVARACVAAKGRRPAPRCAANERWDGRQCIAPKTETPPRRPPATDKPADTRPTNPKSCPRGQHLDRGQCVSNQAACPAGTHKEGNRCIGDASEPRSCPAGQQWNARSKSCVPKPGKRPPRQSPCPPGKRCK